MGCQSEVAIGDNLTFSITTHDPDTGVLTDADDAPTYRVYEDETAAAILNGAMTVLDDVNTTGFYTEQISCTAANGFEDGKSYTIYIEATVDGDTGGISYGFRAMTPVWSVSSRTLTQSATQVAAAVSGSAISVNSYTTWDIDLTDIGDISARTKLYFTAKTDPDNQPDSAAIVHILLSEPADAATDGLLYIDGAAATTATDGSITVTDETSGDITITVSADVTGITKRQGRYGVKMVTATGVTEICEGWFTIEAPPPWAVA